MKIFRTLLFGFVFLFCSNGMAQKASPYTKFSDRIFYGGSLGLAVGHVTQIDIMPVTGIWIFPQWSVGVGGRYSYYSHSGYVIGATTRPSRTHIWGGSVFTQILPIPDFSEVLPIDIKGGLFFHAEYEKLLINRQLVNPLVTTQPGKTWIDLYLVGLGYRQRLGEKAAFNIMLLWDVSPGSYSPYLNNPMIRINFTL